MSRQMSLSDTGLRLIKAFEGYRPVDRELVTGARVVGYGHRVRDERPRAMSRAEAEDTLRLDLAAYEELVNDEVHAPLSQSQFDALCSLAFNIGPKAFRGSDCLRALNNGRVLDAANGFDIWRKATVNGDTYVVDALMRRRTAEKSLFLRTEKSVPAPGAMLDPVADPDAAVPTDDGLPVFTEDMSAGVIARLPYDAVPNPRRRREDQMPGVLTLSEVIEPGAVADINALPEAEFVEDIVETTQTAGAVAPERSVIGEAADALSDRLDALIDGGDDAPDAEPDWPQSLIKAATPEPDEGAEPDNLVAFPGTRDAASLRIDGDNIRSETLSTGEIRDRLQAKAAEANAASLDAPADVVIDDLAADDIMRDSRPPNGRLHEDVAVPDVEPVAGLWIPILLGFALLGASIAALVLDARALLGEWGPLLALAGAVTGALMVVYALYLLTAGRLRDAP